MAIYINSWEHLSCLEPEQENVVDLFNKKSDQMKNKIYPLLEPIDLYEYIEKRGTKWKDNFTKLSSYIARKLCIYEMIPERLGVIIATEYGNLNNMCRLSSLAINSSEPISAQLFPNATLSSAAVTVSLSIQAKGFNATINSGISSFYQAIMLASLYISNDKLDYCIIITGDDYNDFAIEDIKASGIKAKKFLSTINGVLLSKNKLVGKNNYIVDSVDVNRDTIDFNKKFAFVGGYQVSKPERGIVIPDVYIGPSIGFIGLLNCFKRLEKEKNIDNCSAMIIDNTLCTTISIGREKSNVF